MVAQTRTVFAHGSPKTRTILPIVAQSREIRDRPPPMPLAFGAVGFLFFIHFLVIPIELSMARPFVECFSEKEGEFRGRIL